MTATTGQARGGRGSPSPTDLPGLSGVPATPGDQEPTPRKAYVEQIMGLPISVHVRGPQAAEPEVHQAVAAAFAALRADDAQFSSYRHDSAVSRIRRGELALAEASPRMREVVALCEEASARTDGAFSAWLPQDGATVFDPTGLVKGWAVQHALDRLVADLADLGPHDVLVSAGGDVIVDCARTDTPDWSIAVEDPADRSQMLTSFPMRRGAVATSGTAARGEHVLDPRTGAAATALLSATVVGPTLTWADVYATAVLASGGDVPWFGSLLEDHTALLVRVDGSRQVLRRDDGRAAPSRDAAGITGSDEP